MPFPNAPGISAAFTAVICLRAPVGSVRTGCPLEIVLDNLALFRTMDVSLAAIVPHKEAALALAADRLSERAGMAYEDVKAALGPTALGRGIALPHALARECRQPACALVGLARPVDFNAPDGIGVDVVMALIWPESAAEGFVRQTSLLGRILFDPVVLDAVRGETAPGRIRSLFHSRAGALALAGLPDDRMAGHVAGLPRP